jgi:hypothetical protein
VSVAQRRRISTLIMGRFARNLAARASGGTVALSRLWPGRADRLIIAPHDLRTADATRAAEIYAGRFVFAGKIVTCHGRSIFDLGRRRKTVKRRCLASMAAAPARRRDTALTRANARPLVTTDLESGAPRERRADAGAPCPPCRRRRWCSATPTNALRNLRGLTRNPPFAHDARHR